MKLFGTPGSPYARKVRIVLAEKHIRYEYVIERPSAPGSRVPQFNPLGKIPVLVLDDGRTVYDSPVIVEYLDAMGSGTKLIPDTPDERMEVKRWEALGDGIADATVAISHEYREPADRQRTPEWFEKQRLKIDRGLDAMEKALGASEFCCGSRFSLADIATGYALSYLDFALAEVEWRQRHPALERLAAHLEARSSFSDSQHTK